MIWQVVLWLVFWFVIAAYVVSRGKDYDYDPMD
jgi:hypothetical protein